MHAPICYKHIMEPLLLLKLVKVEIFIIVIICYCIFKRRQPTPHACNLIWPLLLGFIYWQLLSPEQWTSPDGIFSLTKWQFTIKFCLVVHAGVCWTFTTNTSHTQLARWLSVLLITMLLSMPAKAPAAISACLASHLIIFIFIFNRKSRKKNLIISTGLFAIISVIYCWFSEPIPFIIFMQWLPIISLIFYLALLGNYCKNHQDTELREFVFYLIGLIWILALHFCILKTVAWSSNSINIDIAVLAKIGLSWILVLLGFQWSIPSNQSTHAYSLLIPMLLIITLFIQMPQAKTFQALVVTIPVFFMQFWWLGHCYQSRKTTDFLESLLLLLNCFLIMVLIWWLKPLPLGLWNFSPTLSTLYSLTVCLAIFGIIRRRKIRISINHRAFTCGIIIALGLGYFISTVSTDLYLHIRDEYKEATFILESTGY